MEEAKPTTKAAEAPEIKGSAYYIKKANEALTATGALAEGREMRAVAYVLMGILEQLEQRP